MAGLRNSKWDVINRYLATGIGDHRTPGWTLGRAREAAFAGVWDDLVTESLAPVLIRSITDSNVNSSCVYETADGDSLYVSTVLPYITAWSAEKDGFLDTSPPWADTLISAGFSYLDSSATRTLSPYVDTDAERRITYFEILFEWIEGSDGPDESMLVDPWRP